MPFRPITDTGASLFAGSSMLAEALSLEQRLHLPGVRDGYRNLLEKAVALLAGAIDELDDSAAIMAAQRGLLRACAARAEDARYGAGQLSRGSQRAPTREDCDDGWLRVEEIVSQAEASAEQARRLADELDEPAARQCASRAERAASAARQTIRERNHAYTFHTDPAFSFGEGWYLAAAAVLEGVFIQIRPNTAQALQAERFLREAGLSSWLTAYRSRPRSPKHLTVMIADAFRENPTAAQKALRKAFLGEERPAPFLVDWVESRLGKTADRKVLLWVRKLAAHDTHRDTDFAELAELANLVLSTGLVPVFFGDAIPKELAPETSLDLTLAWKEPLFQGLDMRRAQLQLFELMKERHALAGQLGVTTAGMDGPALMGLPTIYLTEKENVRMQKWVGAVPGYLEIVRQEGYMESIGSVLNTW